MYTVTAVVISDDPATHETRVRLSSRPLTFTEAQRYEATVNNKPDHPFYADARIETWRAPEDN